MNSYEERIEKMQEHLQKNPTDWQAVIDLFKLRSEFFSWKRNQRRSKMIERVEAIKRGERVGE